MLIETIRCTTNITMYTKISDKHFANFVRFVSFVMKT